MSQRDWNDAHPFNAALNGHADEPEFGVRLIADALIYEIVFTVGGNPVARLSSLQGISSTILKHRGLAKNARPAVHDDHLKRGFTTDEVNI